MSRATRNSMSASDRRNRRAALMRMQNKQCAWCGRKQNLTIDHVIPKSFGGPNSLSNLQLLCYNCNAAKLSAITGPWYPVRYKLEVLAWLERELARNKLYFGDAWVEGEWR